jgi:hypothetical protein
MRKMEYGNKGAEERTREVSEETENN